MATTITASTISAALKKIYDKNPERIFDATKQAHPLFDRIKKEHGFGGGLSATSAPYQGGFQLCPIKYATNQGASVAFATAQANAGSPKYKAFLLDRKERFSYALIDAYALQCSKEEFEGFIEGMESMVEDDVLAPLGDMLAKCLFQDGYGAIGQVTGTPGGTSFVVTPSNAIANFEVGMVLVAAANKASAIRAAGTNTMTVTAIDRSAATVTVGAVVTGLADLDFVFIEGDYTNATKNLPMGFAGWIPLTAPSSSEDFFSVDRSTDCERLAGCRLVRTGYAIREAFVDIAGEVCKWQTRYKPSLGVCSDSIAQKLAKEIDARAYYDWTRMNPTDKAKFGTPPLMLVGPRGPIEILSDNFCPDDRIYVLSPETWTWYYRGKDVVQIMDWDNTSIFRVYNAASYELRAVSWSQIGCHFPGANGVASVTL